VPNAGSGVQQWRSLVLQALKMEGLSASLVNNVLYQMQTESGGNPNAINLTDSNAQAGDPSKGLMQVIGSTFAAFHWPGTSSNIYDPLANIAAALNYASHTYGPNLANQYGGIGSGHGYRNGGLISENVYGIGALSGDRYKFDAGENVQSREAAMATANKLDTLIALTREQNKINAAIPQATGRHVGGAISGVGSDAAWRGRYPASR
jgi:SLT domain-containing protein